MRPEGDPFLEHGVSFPDGTERYSHPDSAQPRPLVDHIPSPLPGVGHDLRCPCLSCYNAQSEQHWLVSTLPAVHLPWPQDITDL